ncbi:MAG: phosphoenolpyruvate--protein phosphotransferase [Fusobacteria bacterium]|nr:phosphoenolpyruvate--protein phosphotransferase [Fusobacteriota bacterium]
MLIRINLGGKLREIKGVVASEGIAIGRALVVKPINFKNYFKGIAFEEVAQEKSLFKSAIKVSQEQIEEIRLKTLKSLGEEKAAIFEGHIMLLEDESLEEEVFEEIETNGKNAAYAVDSVIDRQFIELSQIDDEYLKERAFDIRDIGDRLLKNILGLKVNSFELENPQILVVMDITPSDIAQLDITKVLGIVSVHGGKTSHSAIIARSYGIPSLCGISQALETIESGEKMVLDAQNGMLFIEPSSELEVKYEKKLEEIKIFQERLTLLKGKETITLDGRKVLLEGNIGVPSDIANVLKNDAEGIGLFRTEFQYMDRSAFPTEEEQFQSYKEVAVGMKGKPVIIRTLDIGGDKELSYFDIPKEENPFLGWRAVRICLDIPEIIRTQLRALLRASAFGKVKIMFPMIISKSEIMELKAIAKEEMAKLGAEGIAYDKEVEFGIMIETPAAAVMADVFCQYIDFFSIGTNDLTQYTLAVDRGNQKIEKLYNSFNPGVLKMIDMSIRAGRRAGIETGMCGEFAGDIKSVVLLLGMGLDNFSMSPSSVLKVKDVILKLNYEEAKKITKQALQLEEAHEVIELVTEFLKSKKII